VLNSLFNPHGIRLGTFGEGPFFVGKTISRPRSLIGDLKKTAAATEEGRNGCGGDDEDHSDHVLGINGQTCSDEVQFSGWKD
jgi:hypothetical protein